MMTIAYLITITLENQVPASVQQSIAAQMPFMSMPTGGNLVVSFGSFLLATLAADVVLSLPLYFLDRRGR